VEAAGFSAENVAFGMGGGLLQRVDRDTMSFATKLSYIVYKDGSCREVMKRPKTDGGKLSLPGILKVRREGGKLWVEPRTPAEAYDASTNELKVVYDYGPVNGGVWDDFSTVRARVNAQWHATPKVHNPVSPAMTARIAEWIRNFDQSYADMMGQIDRDSAEALAAASVAKATQGTQAEQHQADELMRKVEEERKRKRDE
jgi:nicotinamide phosphoribosyltransferase